jgi:hypothetical protein
MLKIVPADVAMGCSNVLHTDLAVSFNSGSKDGDLIGGPACFSGIEESLSALVVSLAFTSFKMF